MVDDEFPGIPTVRDWRSVFRVIMSDDVRENVKHDDACAMVGAYREFMGFFDALTAGTENDARCPEGLNKTFAYLANHLLETHGAELPESEDVTDDERDSLTRVMFYLLPVFLVVSSMN
jgi:hypothetical protein